MYRIHPSCGMATCYFVSVIGYHFNSERNDARMSFSQTVSRAEIASSRVIGRHQTADSFDILSSRSIVPVLFYSKRQLAYNNKCWMYNTATFQGGFHWALPTKVLLSLCILQFYSWRITHVECDSTFMCFKSITSISTYVLRAYFVQTSYLLSFHKQ